MKPTAYMVSYTANNWRTGKPQREIRYFPADQFCQAVLMFDRYTDRMDYYGTSKVQLFAEVDSELIEIEREATGSYGQ